MAFSYLIFSVGLHRYEGIGKYHIRHGKEMQYQALKMNHIMTNMIRTLSLFIGIVVLIALGFLEKGHASTWWPGTFDLMIAIADKQENGAAWDPEASDVPFHLRPASTTAAASLPDVMLCIVDTAGEAQCHHREGIIEGHANIPGGTVCRGGESQLKAYCEDSTICFLRSVAVPKDIFGLLILEIDPPLHHQPRHRVIDGMVVMHTATDQANLAYNQVKAALHSLALCLAPTQPVRQQQEAFPVLMRTDCEDHLCTLRHSALWFAPQVKTTAELR
jgi:hypothetical protein